MKIEVANGEIVDKFTILSIKLQKIQDADKRANIRKEHQLLEAAVAALGLTTGDPDVVALQAVNQKLWEVEDQIRRLEASQTFDQTFIELARSVYIHNDRRAELKRRINLKTGSVLIEEKEYAAY